MNSFVKNSIIAIIFIISIPISANASCSNLLRLQVLKRMRLESQVKVFNKEDRKHFDRRKKELKEILFSYGSKRRQLKTNISEAFRMLKIFLKSKIVEKKFNKAIETITEAMYDPKLMHEWADQLYRELVLETYVEGTREQINALETNLELSHEIAANLLAFRSMEGGFDGQIAQVDSIMAYSFLSTLAMKRVFMTNSFEVNNHGKLIHLLQTDYIIYALKKAKLDPKFASEIYAWIGNTKGSIYLERTGDSLTPQFSVWSTNFYSYDKALRNPEILAQIFQNYFRWY